MASVKQDGTNGVPLVDTIEKLKADVLAATRKTGTANQEDVWRWLDRQDAITQRECIDRWDNKALMLYADMKAERDELQAKLDEFEGDCYCGATVVQWYEHSVLQQRQLDDIERTHMRLPVDADGVPIRTGDRLEGGTVFAVGEDAVVYEPGIWDEASLCRHVKPETVESLLTEFAEGFEGQNEDFSRLVVAEYAERIRKAVEHG